MYNCMYCTCIHVLLHIHVHVYVYMYPVQYIYMYIIVQYTSTCYGPSEHDFWLCNMQLYMYLYMYMVHIHVYTCTCTVCACALTCLHLPMNNFLSSSFAPALHSLSPPPSLSPPSSLSPSPLSPRQESSGTLTENLKWPFSALYRSACT